MTFSKNVFDVLKLSYHHFTRKIKLKKKTRKFKIPIFKTKTSSKHLYGLGTIINLQVVSKTMALYSSPMTNISALRPCSCIVRLFSKVQLQNMYRRVSCFSTTLGQVINTIGVRGISYASHYSNTCNCFFSDEQIIIALYTRKYFCRDIVTFTTNRLSSLRNIIYASAKVRAGL